MGSVYGLAYDVPRVWPQPQLVDIEFDDAGDMILGVHDRMADMSGSNLFITNQIEKPGLGLGDLIWVPVKAGGGWDPAAADPDHFAQPSGSEADRSHLGVDLARQLLLAGEHRGANLPAIVLLTDGRSNPDPSQLALDAAAAAKAAGIRLFTVGLGQDV